MSDNIVNIRGEVIPKVIELEEAAANDIRRRLAFIAQAEHSLNSMKLELEMHIKHAHPETAEAKQIGISPDATKIEYS